MSVKLNNRDYIWSYVGVIVSVGSSALMLPFVLHFLSEEMYGLWGVFQSVAAITTLFDFGFSVTFARNINYAWCGATELKKTGVVFAQSGEPNFPLMKRTMTACRYVFLLLSALALVCMAGPGTIYIRYISRGIPGWEPMAAWAFYGCAVFLNLYYGYFNAFLRGVGAISAANRVMVFSRVLQIVLTVVLLSCGFGIVGAGVAYLVYGFALRMLSKRAYLHYRGIGEGLKGVTAKVTRREVRELFSTIWFNASKEGVVTLSEYLANQACTILAPLFLTLSETGTYSLAMQLATVVANVAGTMYNANQPALQSAYISHDSESTRRTMSLIVVSFVELYILGISAVAVLGLPVLRLIKTENIPSCALMLGAGLYQFILKFRSCYCSYFSCTNRIPYVTSFIISAVGCVLMAFVLLRYSTLGIWGLLLAQIVSQCAYNAWHWPAAAHREMGLSISETAKVGNTELLAILKGFIKR